MVMGANIGTTVTAKIVSLGHITRKSEFRRAFAASSVHDTFNLVTVAIMLPLEYSFHILGCGAIGSSAATQLARSGAINFFLYDMDKVEDVNVGVSQYNVQHVGKNKVQALNELITDINPYSMEAGFL